MRNNQESTSSRLIILVVTLIVALVVVPLVTAQLKATVTKTSSLLPASAGTSPFTVLLNSLRASVGDTIFMKTEIYLHEGVNYFSMGEDEEHGEGHSHEHENLMEGKGVSFEDMNTSHSDANTTTSDAMTTGMDQPHADHRDTLAHEDVEHMHTVIPKANDDFRSFIGVLERKVKPWREEHIEEHGKGIELIPWYRVATLADPHNVRCYIIGAWWLASADGKGRIKEAENFIREGIKNNPNDFQLRIMLGELLERQELDKEAISEFRKGFEAALQIRPENGILGKNRTTYEESDFMTAAHMMVLLTRDTETTEAAIQLGEKLAQQVPDLLSLRRILTKLKSASK